MTRAAIYRRVSGRKQAAEDRHSLPEQLDKCTERCKIKGYDIVADLSETHTGADLEDRPEMSKLLDMMAGREIDVLVATNLDRLSREMNHQGVIYHVAKRYGVTIELTEEEFEDTTSGRFLRMTAGFIAEFEREKTRERTRRGIAHRVKQGLMLPGRYPLYGYRYADERKSRYVEDPTTGPIVRRIWHEALEGKTIRQIAFDLTREGTPTPQDWQRLQKNDPKDPPQGRSWHPSTIHFILDNPSYYGQHDAFRWQDVKEHKKDGVSGKMVLRTGKRKRAIGDRRVILEGAAPALVSLEVAREVAHRLAQNKEAAHRNNPAPECALLRNGYVKCALCGQTLHVSSRGRRTKSNKVVYIYRCGHNRTNPLYKDFCTGVMAHAARLDRIVWRRVVNVLRRPGIFMEEAEARFNDHGQQDILDGYRQQVKTIEAREAKVRKAIQYSEDEQIEGLVLDLKTLAAEKQKALAQADRLERDHIDWQASYSRMKDVSAWIQTIDNSGETMPYKLKRSVLYAISLKVVVHPHGTIPRFTITAGSHGEIDLTEDADCVHTSKRV